MGVKNNMDYQIFQIPDLLEVFFKEMPNTFGDLLNFVRAFGSVLGLILGIFGIICLGTSWNARKSLLELDAVITEENTSVTKNIKITTLLCLNNLK